MSAAERFEPLTAPPLLALPEVLQLTGYGRSALYEAVLEQLMPRPVKVGRASRWPLDEVVAVRAALLRDDDESARRALVRQLHARRCGGTRLALA